MNTLKTMKLYALNGWSLLVSELYFNKAITKKKKGRKGGEEGEKG